MTTRPVGPRPIIHGLPSSYSVRKCRCADCRKGWAACIKRHRDKRRLLGLCVTCKNPSFGFARCETHRLAIKVARALRSDQR